MKEYFNGEEINTEMLRFHDDKSIEMKKIIDEDNQNSTPLNK